MLLIVATFSSLILLNGGFRYPPVVLILLLLSCCNPNPLRTNEKDLAKGLLSGEDQRMDSKTQHLRHLAQLHLTVLRPDWKMILTEESGSGPQVLLLMEKWQSR